MTEYSTRGFLRQVSNELLQSYFRAKAIDLDVNWDSLEETDVEPVNMALIGLDDDIRTLVEGDFAAIHEMANDEGVAVIIDEAAGPWHGNLDLAAIFGELDDHHDMVMWTFVNHPRVFDIASQFHSADRISQRSWQSRRDLPNTKPRNDQQACAELASSLCEFFTAIQGRGRHCHVDVYQRRKDFYYFAFPEDYARAEQDYVGASLTRQTHRPVFQVVFVYSPVRRALDVHAPGGKRVIAKLQDRFAAVILGSSLPPGTGDERVYELDRLRDRRFEWQYPPSAGISAVWVKSLRLSLKAHGAARIVIEGRSNGQVFDLYERLTGVNGAYPADAFEVTRAEVRAEFAPQNGRSVRAKTFSITWPNTCNLGQDERSIALREMLIESGIDPGAIGRDTLR
jgi:hypothetical protein